LEEGDPFLRRLMGSAVVEAKEVEKKLEEMADDATEVLTPPPSFPFEPGGVGGRWRGNDTRD